MDMGDVFRRLFGLPQHRSHPDWHDNRYPSHNNEGAFFEDDDSFEFFFGSPDNKDGLDSMFEHFNGGIFTQMEHLHRQMDEMMRGFGAINFPPAHNHPALPPGSPPIADKNEDEKGRGNPSIWFGNPSPFFHQGSAQQPNSPRDFMLKDGVDGDPVTSAPSTSNTAPPQKTPKISPIYTPSKPEKIHDTDLDGKLSDHDILSLVKPQVDPREQQPQQPQQPRHHQPGFFSSSSSVTFSSFTGADGKVEKKKVVRDSSGREETTVTRSVGDKSHSVTTVTTHDGSQEKHETFQNMDEKDMGTFENVWTSPSRQPKNPVDDLVLPTLGLQIDPHDRNIFSRLFGFGEKK